MVESLLSIHKFFSLSLVSKQCSRTTVYIAFKNLEIFKVYGRMCGGYMQIIFHFT